LPAFVDDCVEREKKRGREGEWRVEKGGRGEREMLSWRTPNLNHK